MARRCGICGESGHNRRTCPGVDAREPVPARTDGRCVITLGDNLPVLEALPAESIDLIYVDPPFNTGKVQRQTRIRTTLDTEGDRVGFQGRRYRTEVLGSKAYPDVFDDYLGFLAPRLEQAHRILRPGGSLFVHLDPREVHHAKVYLDGLFGRDCFQNEIIWSYDYGARSRSRWSAKHDNILWYSRHPKHYTYRYDDIDRIPYMAPKLVGPEKAARGKTPTDVWWQTIVPPRSRERTGYPNQKPLAILRRIVRVHSNPGDSLLDFFAGSGGFGEAALEAGRSVQLVDCNPEAVTVMRRRLARFNLVVEGVSETEEAVPSPTQPGLPWKEGAHP